MTKEIYTEPQGEVLDFFVKRVGRVWRVTPDLGAFSCSLRSLSLRRLSLSAFCCSWKGLPDPRVGFALGEAVSLRRLSF